MNQKELNIVAIKLIHAMANELAQDILEKLKKHIDSFAEEIPGRTLQHIHSFSLYHALTVVNSPLPEESSDETIDAYRKYSAAKLENFMEICEGLQDFELTNDFEPENSYE